MKLDVRASYWPAPGSPFPIGSGYLRRKGVKVLNHWAFVRNSKVLSVVTITASSPRVLSLSLCEPHSAW